MKMEITKTIGSVKHTVYEAASLTGANVSLIGELTLSKAGKVVQYTGVVFNQKGERIGEFGYYRPNTPYMGQNGVSVRLTDSENIGYYAETVEVLTSGLVLFELA